MEPGRGSLAVTKLYSAICPEKKTKKGAIAAQYLTLTYQASINSRFHKPTMTVMTYKSYSVLYTLFMWQLQNTTLLYFLGQNTTENHNCHVKCHSTVSTVIVNDRLVILSNKKKIVSNSDE